MNSGVDSFHDTSTTLVMGVVNVTPDSFFSPSASSDPNEVRRRIIEMIECGAHCVDIGGESSRPGAEPLGEERELDRIIPVFDALDGVDVTLSIDTYRAGTAQAAIDRGATMVNDITALRGDVNMAATVAESGVLCVLMHMLGTPQTMQREPQYENIVDDLCAFFDERISYAVREGIEEKRLWLDPGFGFGKTVDHNLTLLRDLAAFKKFGLPLLIGTSNKSTIGAVLDVPIDERMEGTAATIAVAIQNGANGVRVHDVRAMGRVARMCDAILTGMPYNRVSDQSGDDS